MIRLDARYNYATNTWNLTGKVKSTTSRLKSKGYNFDSNRLSWQPIYWTNAPKIAPKVLAVWSK